jgi:hypothetical protein
VSAAVTVNTVASDLASWPVPATGCVDGAVGWRVDGECCAWEIISNKLRGNSW